MKSTYVADEIYNINYTLITSNVDSYDIYSSVPSAIIATFYENYEMIAPIYLTRILDAFPHEFTDDTNLDYISIKFETAFIVPTDGNYTFYVIVSKNSKVDLMVQGIRMLTIDNSLFSTLVTKADSTQTSTKITCDSTYGTSSCCLDTEQSFNLNTVYLTADPVLFEL